MKVCKHCVKDPESYSSSPEWWAYHWIAHAKQEMREVLKLTKGTAAGKVLTKRLGKLATDSNYEDFPEKK